MWHSVVVWESRHRGCMAALRNPSGFCVRVYVGIFDGDGRHRSICGPSLRPSSQSGLQAQKFEDDSVQY